MDSIEPCVCEWRTHSTYSSPRWFFCSSPTGLFYNIISFGVPSRAVVSCTAKYDYDDSRERNDVNFGWCSLPFCPFPSLSLPVFFSLLSLFAAYPGTITFGHPVAAKRVLRVHFYMLHVSVSHLHPFAQPSSTSRNSVSLLTIQLAFFLFLFFSFSNSNCSTKSFIYSPTFESNFRWLPGNWRVRKKEVNWKSILVEAELPLCVIKNGWIAERVWWLFEA